MDQQERAGISAAYLRFTEEEARGRSALYDELARGVASDPLVIAFLLTLPKEKRQPNLLFAATRLLSGTPIGWGEFRRAVRENEDAIRAIMLKRSTQTNEPARCATLLPVLARLPQPLALIEVGASAGLCLIPIGMDMITAAGSCVLRRTNRTRPFFRASRMRQRRSQLCPRGSLGEQDSISIRSTSPTPTKSLGLKRWSGPSRLIAWQICALRSGLQRRISRASSRAIYGLISPGWSQRHRRMPRWSSSIRRFWPTSVLQQSERNLHDL